MLPIYELCLKRTAQVRAAATELNNAYLLRARLHRLTLGLQKLLDERWLLETVSDDQEASTLRVLALELSHEARHLSQRSTVLDENWEEGWHNLHQKLHQLEGLLQAQRTLARSER